MTRPVELAREVQGLSIDTLAKLHGNDEWPASIVGELAREVLRLTEEVGRMRKSLEDVARGFPHAGDYGHSAKALNDYFRGVAQRALQAHPKEADRE